MNRKNLIRFLEKELGVKQVSDGAGGWLRGCCPTHSETRASWGIYAEAEYHPSKCFVCGVNSIFGLTMKVLEIGAKEANALLTKYGYVGEGLNSEQLGRLSFPSYENRIPTIDAGSIPTYMLAPYEGKNLDVAQRRYDYDEEYLRALRIGVDSVNHRVIVPWFYNGKLVGVTGRHIKQNPFPEPKTLPYFDFKKGKALYLPTGRIDGSRPFGLFEGEGDAINVNRVYDNVGAVGTATVTEEQKKLLLSHGVTDLFTIRDPDKAGVAFVESVKRVFSKSYCKVIPLRPHPTKDAGAMLKMEIKNRLKELVWLS